MKEEVFRSHAIWKQIEAVEIALTNFSEQHKEHDNFADIGKKLAYLKWILEKSDAALISTQELTSSVGVLQNIANHLPNNAQSWQRYGQIENYFATLFGKFPYPRLQKIFRSEANEAIEQVTGQAAQLNAELETSLNRVENEFNRLSEKYLVSEKRLSEVDKSLDDLRASVDSQQNNWEANLEARVTNKLTEWTELFSNQESERKSLSKEKLDEVSSILKEMRNSQETLIQANDKALSKVASDAKIAHADYQSKAEAALKQLSEVYDEASQNALAGGFVQASVSEHNAFRIYSAAATIFMTAAAFVLAVLWLRMSEDTVLSLTTLLAKLPISAILLVPAFYLASLASRARRTSLSLRSRGLRIKAFDAYLTGSKEPERLALRERLADEFFMETIEQPSKASLFSFGGGKMADLTEKIIDKIPGGN